MCIRDRYKPRNIEGMEIQFGREDFDFDIQLESEQKMQELFVKFKARKDIDKSDRSKRILNSRKGKIIKEYELLFKEVNPGQMFDLAIPEGEEEMRSFITGLAEEIKQMKEQKQSQALLAEQDMKVAKQMYDAEEKSQAKSHNKKPPNPPNANPQVVTLQQQINEIYNDDLDYEKANFLLIGADNNTNTALDLYASQYMAKLNFVHNSKTFSETISLNKSGDDLIVALMGKLNAYGSKKIGNSRGQSCQSSNIQ
eukprot:TRINITY_DN1173_c0_g1_i1.p1 TRINITY_DN1173_c0_g1~~TRINITY_DN1173_c0_g1_i1.p1  ORF type:complete len:254 (-),score=61.58 TRINITY_DN1173_c0_g1_i1:52-813(-)